MCTNQSLNFAHAKMYDKISIDALVKKSQNSHRFYRIPIIIMIDQGMWMNIILARIAISIQIYQFHNSNNMKIQHVENYGNGATTQLPECGS